MPQKPRDKQRWDEIKELLHFLRSLLRQVVVLAGLVIAILWITFMLFAR